MFREKGHSRDPLEQWIKLFELIHIPWDDLSIYFNRKIGALGIEQTDKQRTISRKSFKKYQNIAVLNKSL